MTAATTKKFAFADEVASLTSVSPSAVGTVAAVGTGGGAAREDHVHILGNGSVPTAALQADCVDGTKIADGAVGSEHIEALSAALDFAHQQATSLVVMNSAAVPAGAVKGEIFYDTDDDHVYIVTVPAS
ncbi:TPA_asm: hypothetical protein vir530_00039 [dsDNA virus vir530]|nr:TPA_asm: hypothetical protein vir530_00039 [dsDNA virus vir530]